MEGCISWLLSRQTSLTCTVCLRLIFLFLRLNFIYWHNAYNFASPPSPFYNKECFFLTPTVCYLFFPPSLNRCQTKPKKKGKNWNSPGQKGWLESRPTQCMGRKPGWSTGTPRFNQEQKWQRRKSFYHIGSRNTVTHYKRYHGSNPKSQSPSGWK